MTAQEREEALRGLFPLVKRIAARLHRLIPGSDRDDLVGDGCIGAIKAVDRFREIYNVPLPHYAARVIAGSMLNGLRSRDTVPERVRRELRYAERERFIIAAQTGSLPTPREMEAQNPRLQRARTLAARCIPLSLDHQLPIGERISCDWTGDPSRIVADRSEREQLIGALHALPPRQRQVLAQHYVYGRPLSQIGAAMNISPQRASQLHLAAMQRLRKALHAAP